MNTATKTQAFKQSIFDHIPLFSQLPEPVKEKRLYSIGTIISYRNELMEIADIDNQTVTLESYTQISRNGFPVLVQFPKMEFDQMVKTSFQNFH